MCEQNVLSAAQATYEWSPHTGRNYPTRCAGVAKLVHFPEESVVHGWQAAEAGLPAEERLYCPYPPCSTLMVKGPNFGKPGKTACPHCQGCGALPSQPVLS